MLLPTEDLENGCLQALVAEIFAEMILGNGISGKACEGWVLWEGITRIGEVLQHPGPEEEKHEANDDNSEQPLSRLERYGLLVPPVEEQYGSSRPQLVHTERHQDTSMAAGLMFWMVVQYVLLAGTALRAAIGFIATSSSLPMRCAVVASGLSTAEAGHHQHPPLELANQAEKQLLTYKRPIISMKLWSCASQFVELETRMPWLSGLISMLRWGALGGPGRVGNINGVLDR